MDIVCCNNSGIFVYDRFYTLQYYRTGLPYRLLNPVMADIDGDGLTEIVVVQANSGAGRIYTYETPAPTPNPRPRSEVHFYSERRCGAAEYVPPPGWYVLKANVVGSGSVTKSPNQVSYARGAVVTLTANPAAGWTFIGWSGDLTGSTNPTTITMDEDKEVNATFTESAILFEDGFESGTFSAWTSTVRSPGETTGISNTSSHSGKYSGSFGSDGSGGYERAYAMKGGLSATELFAHGHFNVDQSGIDVNGDRFYFMTFVAGSSTVAYAGWVRDTSGHLHWQLIIRSGTSYVGFNSAATPALNTWYSVELHWKSDSVSGLGELYVNGALVCSRTNTNTSNYGPATYLRVGLPEIVNCATTMMYADDIALAGSYIGP
jgi:uncharacterized repeat protein (TIGR02543 family)